MIDLKDILLDIFIEEDIEALPDITI